MTPDFVHLPPLPPAFFRQATPLVARALLGKVLVVGRGRAALAAEIVETEAYLGAADPASHAYRGPTARNAAMFEGGGTCYVYLSYGVHYCMNVVTQGVGSGEAVLVRAVAPLVGAEVMARNRGLPPLPPAPSSTKARQLSGGPGKVTAALGISLRDNGRRFDEPDLKIVDGGCTVLRGGIVTTPRIGISKAAELPLRFYVKNSPYPSS